MIDVMNSICITLDKLNIDLSIINKLTIYDEITLKLGKDSSEEVQISFSNQLKRNNFMCNTKKLIIKGSTFTEEKHSNLEYVSLCNSLIKNIFNKKFNNLTELYFEHILFDIMYLSDCLFTNTKRKFILFRNKDKLSVNMECLIPNIKIFDVRNSEVIYKNGMINEYSLLTIIHRLMIYSHVEIIRFMCRKVTLMYLDGIVDTLLQNDITSNEHKDIISREKRIINFTGTQVISFYGMDTPFMILMKQQTIIFTGGDKFLEILCRTANNIFDCNMHIYKENFREYYDDVNNDDIQEKEIAINLSNTLSLIL